MESAHTRQAVDSDRQPVEIELDRPTLALAVENLQHFADHDDDPGFIEKNHRARYLPRPRVHRRCTYWKRAHNE